MLLGSLQVVVGVKVYVTNTSLCKSDTVPVTLCIKLCVTLWVCVLKICPYCKSDTVLLTLACFSVCVTVCVKNLASL